MSQGLWSGIVIHVMMYHQYQFPGQSPSTQTVHSPCLTCELSVAELPTHAILMLVSHSNVTFQLLFPSDEDPIDLLDEVVEFSVQFGSERDWIPITLAIPSGITVRNNAISIGTEYTKGNILIRGYLAELKMASYGDYSTHSVTVCDVNSEKSVQFRWLQTSLLHIISSEPVRDAWTLDNVLITYQNGQNETFVLFDGSK